MKFDENGQIAQQYTDRECISALQEVAEDVGGSPSQEQYLSTGKKPGVTTIKNRFGSWNEAKQEAELDTDVWSYDVDLCYFETINRKTAYWLGFLFGDGCIPDKENTSQLYIALSANDEEHLLKFRDEVAPEKPIYRYEENSFKYSRLEICRIELIDSLERHGLDCEKTESGVVPDLNDEMFGHFTRGLFDADGSVKRRGDGTVEICGNKERLETVSERAPVDGAMWDGDTSTYLYWNSKKTPQMLRWMYPNGIDTEPALSRKKERLIDA